jgi:hypothetical protein
LEEAAEAVDRQAAAVRDVAADAAVPGHARRGISPQYGLIPPFL